MCGYCIEGGAALDFIESEKFSQYEEWVNNDITVYLQESTHFPQIIKKLKKLDGFHVSIDLAFCRLWEECSKKEFSNIYHCLVVEYGEKVIDNYLSELQNNHYLNETFNFLGDGNLYTSSACRENLFRDAKQLVEASESILVAYLDFWVDGKGKAISDPVKRLEETGVIEPFEVTTAEDRETFYTLFPAVFFALLIIQQFNKNSELLKRIALESPHNVPDFLGYDLWLQRKAFEAAVKNHGIQFILDNYDGIRLELIYYTLIKASLCVAELDALKRHILSHQHWVSVIDSASVLELISKLKSAA